MERFDCKYMWKDKDPLEFECPTCRRCGIQVKVDKNIICKNCKNVIPDCDVQTDS